MGSIFFLGQFNKSFILLMNWNESLISRAWDDFQFFLSAVENCVAWQKEFNHISSLYFSELWICLTIMGEVRRMTVFSCSPMWYQSAQAVCMMGRDVAKNSASYFYCRLWFTYSCSHSFLLLLRVLSHSWSPEFKKGFYGVNPAVLLVVRMTPLWRQCHPWEDQMQSLWSVHF